MKRTLVFLTVLLLSATAMGQGFRVYGKVVNNQLEPLAFATIQVKDYKNTTTTSKEDGSFEIQLDPGQYEMIVSMVGYMPTLINILVKGDYEQNFILEDVPASSLSEVVLKSKVKDRAEEVIRQVIENKDRLMAASGAYSSKVYIRATQQNTPTPKNKSKTDTIETEPPIALDKMAMAEISLKMDHASSQQIKEARLGVTRRGDVRNLFYTTVTDGDFNLYNNLIKVPSVSEIPFISPISYSGLMAYRFKTIKRVRTGKHWVYIINIKPRQMSNATVEGEITIDDSSHAILHSKFSLPVYHLPEYDFFEVEQHYDFIQDTAWMISKQKFTYYSKYGKGKKSGETVAVYNGFELNKSFSRGHFGDEVSVTAQEAYEKDSTFWTQTRAEPLTETEIKFIRYKDSITRRMQSTAYLDSMDKITNRITWQNALFLGQAFNDHKKERRWLVPPLISFFQFVQFGGTRLNLSTFYSKNFPSRKEISVIGNVSYGFRNHDVNGSLSFSRKYNPLNGGRYTFAAGRDFQFINEGDAWINMLKRSNIYLNNSFSASHTIGIINGLFLHNELEVALRRSVAHYKTNPKADSLFSSILINDTAIGFDPYNAVYSKIRLDYTPGVKYIREPKEKISLGSKWPTFFIEWRKGLRGIFNSRVAFDYMEYGIEQTIRLRTAGNSSYKIKTGSFINTLDLRLVDYQFMRQGDPLLFSNPQKTFQALDSTFPLFKRFYEGHYVHEFNGLLLNKIPILKKLQLREVAGAGFLIAPERDLKYIEAFAGIERVIKWPFNPLTKFKLGVYIVGSAANKFNNPIQFKIGISRWDWQRNKWL